MGDFVVNNQWDARPVIFVTISGTDINTGEYVCRGEDALPVILVTISGTAAQ